MKRQALGKGLSSLIPEPPLPQGETGLLLIDIDRIRPSRFQPRTDFQGIEELAESIRQNGLVQPILVRQEDDGYLLIAGERRWRAAQLAGVHRIPAVVRKAEDERLLELALIENIQRKDLNPIEEAQAYDVLFNRMRLSQTDVAKRVGRDRSTVSNLLRILKLSDRIKDLVKEGSLSLGHAKAILAIPDGETQIRVAEEVARKIMSVREAETLVAGILRRHRRGEGRHPAEGMPPGGSSDPNTAAAADRLCRALATKVRILRRGNRGKIEIDFFSEEELDRLYSFLLTAERGS